MTISVTFNSRMVHAIVSPKMIWMSLNLVTLILKFLNLDFALHSLAQKSVTKMNSMDILLTSDAIKKHLTLFLELFQKALLIAHAIQEYILSQMLVINKLMLKNLGCIDKSFNKVWEFFEDLTEEFGAILIILGVFLTFFGSKYQSGTLFIAGMLAATIISLVALYGLFIPTYTPDWGHMVSFFVAILIGMVVGLIASMWVKFGMFVLGGWVGGSVGMMLYESFLS